MIVLLVGIEMVNTQTLTSQLKQIDHDLQKYFNQFYGKQSTNIHKNFIKLSVPQIFTLLAFYELFYKIAYFMGM